MNHQTYENSRIFIASSNLVSFTIESLTYLSFPIDIDILIEIFKTLSEYCVGPCPANQLILCKNRGLIIFMNENIIKEKIDLWSQDAYNLKKISLFCLAIKVFLILLFFFKFKF